MRFPDVILFSVCALLLVPPLLAQSPNGVINGLVVDPANKVIAGADILVMNDATGVKYSGKTNEDGIYVVPNLPPGPYRLQVSKLGFKSLIKPDIVLNIQDALSINFTLPVGAAFETVTIEAGAPMINTTDASVSTVIDDTYVKNMPLNGRSFQDLILLTPGVVTQSPQSAAGLGVNGEFSVNGQRTESNYYTVDGVSANVGASAGNGMNYGAGSSGSLGVSTALGTTQAVVSVDALQEFRVQSSTYAAEYGRNPGGQFAFETKSGTNQWHGTAYDYLRNGDLDAQDWFNNYFGLEQPAIRQNDFGGTFGGPVKVPQVYDGKAKTFFFLSYEGLRLTSPQPANVSYVPDLCMRGSATQCPAGRDPAADALLPVIKAFPLPSSNGLEDAPDGIGQFIGTWSNPGSIDSTGVRFDHSVNDKLKLFFRFSDTTSRSASRGLGNVVPPTVEIVAAYTIRAYTAGVDSTLSSRLSNEFRLNYSSNDVTNRNVIDAFGDSTPVDLAQLTGLGPASEPLVFLALGSASPSGLLQAQDLGAQRQWNLVDTVTWASGRHQFKFGADYRRLAPFAAPRNPIADYYYFSEPSVEANSSLTFVQAQAPAYPLYINFSAFAQDELKVSKRLSLSLGLRWDVNPAPAVTQGLLPYAIRGSGPDTWALASQGTPLWRTAWHSFAPRLGVTYILHNTPGLEAVVRGGGGVFYDTAQQGGSIAFQGAGFTAEEPIHSGSFPGPIVIPTILNPPVPPLGLVLAAVPHLQTPYTLQWNVSVEQALGKYQALTLSYVGSHAAKLLQQDQFSTPTNPNSAAFYIIQNGLTSDYNSLQTQFRRRISRGFSALASYTWSHCLDYGSSNFDFGYQRGNCDFDVRHNLSGALSYDVPNVGRHGLVNALLHHWGLDDRLTVRAAFPVSLNGNIIVNPLTGTQYKAGLNFVPGQPVYLYGLNCDSTLRGLGDLSPGKRCPGGWAINPNAFVSVDSGFGNAPRNFARGLGAWQMNLAIRRDFPIHERLKLQFRAEAFNIFNHPNFGTINPNLCSGSACTFGQATATLASSLGILNPLYQTGGARSMQFALKLLF